MKVKLIRKHRHAGFTLIELMVVIAIIATLAGISWGPILDQLNSGDRSAAQTNMTNLHKTMQVFKTDHGSYPCDSTAEGLLEDERYSNVDYGSLTGNTSNCYLRQLFYLSSLNSEENFYAKVNVMGRMTKTPDNKIARGRALERGECGFSYVMAKGDSEDNLKGAVTDGNAPLLMTSLSGRTPVSGESMTFDTESFRNKAIILFNNGSVKQMDLIPDDNDDRKGKLLDVFPENKRTGASKAGNYIVLPPDL